MIFRFLIWMALVAVAPHAHAGSDGLDRLEPIVFGGLVSAVLIVYLTRKRVSEMEGMLLVGPLAFAVGAFFVGVGLAEYRSSLRPSGQTSYASSKLYQQVCSSAGDVAPDKVLEMARAEAAHGLAVVLANCVVVDDPSKFEVFKLLAPVLAEKVGVTNAQQNGEWCLVLEPIHRGAMVNHLRVLMDLKYPLACSTDGQADWWTATEGRRGENNTEVNARRVKFFTELHDAGVAMNATAAPRGRNLLHLVTACDSPSMVLFALRLGIDPSVANPDTNWSPRTEWLLRTLYSQSRECHVRRESPEWDSEVFNDVERLMGKPSASEINMNRRLGGQTPLFLVDETQETLSIMLRLGAQLDLHDAEGNTFLHASQKLDNATLALLRSQPKSVLVRLGKKSDSVQGTPLVTAARRRGDTGLVELLCKHGADGC